MIADYLATFDFNLSLIDAVNDPDIADVRSQIAALALGEDLDSGYYATQELAEAFLEAAREANAVNRRPIGTPYRRAKGTPVGLRGSVDAGRRFRAAAGVGRA